MERGEGKIMKHLKARLVPNMDRAVVAETQDKFIVNESITNM